MSAQFKVEFTSQVVDFLDSLEEKVRDKILFNIDKSTSKRDRELFKKLTSEIWEFRTLYKKKQYRLFAFWDKTQEGVTLVIATHGIVKKTKKTPKKEIEKAIKIKDSYFKDRQDENT